MPFDDTIAAIATPPGVGGIGIIRVSGPLAETIARLLYRSPQGREIPLTSHRLYSGQIVAPASHAVIDEALITLMRKPRSYTGEDVLEIHSHGNPLILEAILVEVIRAGARPATPGEFTRRAFLNNRMDLTRAEALMGLMAARTPRSLEIASAQMQGALQQRIETIRQSLMDILATLETAIDFSEDDGGQTPSENIAAQIESVCNSIRELLGTCYEGALIRKGVDAVIVGRANVGKSSLLNRLSGEERAIVTAIPGTTRDFIETCIDIHGIAVKLTDTAGLRHPDNIIEKEGIDRTWERLSMADLVILLFDGGEPLTLEDHDILDKTRNLNLLPVINKADLDALMSDSALHTWLPDTPPLWISAKTGAGIPALKKAIYRRLVGEQAAPSGEIVVTQVRHKTAMEKTIGYLQQAQLSLADAMSFEFIAFDLRAALDSLGEIVGVTTSEDVLDRIFATFCIGK
jgi:tRNA modification GTPase